MTDTAAGFLTQEAHDRLKAELDQLTGEGRIEIARKIEEAREEGDLKENGGYHAAREEQGKMEARIRQLTQLLQTATIGETPADDGVVEPGMLVTVEIFGDEETFLLGNREIADGSDLQVFSEKSPMGAAVNGKTVGEATSYEAPTGKTIDVKITPRSPTPADLPHLDGPAPLGGRPVSAFDGIQHSPRVAPLPHGLTRPVGRAATRRRGSGGVRRTWAATARATSGSRSASRPTAKSRYAVSTVALAARGTFQPPAWSVSTASSTWRRPHSSVWRSTPPEPDEGRDVGQGAG